DIDNIKNEIQKIKKLTEKPFGVNIAMNSEIKDDLISLVCEEKVPVVTTGAGNPSAYIPKLKSEGIKVIPVVPIRKIALKMESAGADMIIAEGMESGGFIGKISSNVLIPEVTQAVKIPVIAAGGYATGSGMASAFALGASGIQMGTRFMVCKECKLPEVYKQAIIRAGAEDAVVVSAKLDDSVFHRCLRNSEVEEFKKYKNNYDSKSYDEMFYKLCRSKMILGMGQSAGLIDKEYSAYEIIHSIMKEFRQCTKELTLV
ncbi:MAG: nitronate monooxygenase, partial [Ruminococcus sp.]|nr:nitronate monooxygenase [Ruminococcus sp.]